MAIIAKLNYLRIAPRKVRLIANLIRTKNVQEARNILHFAVKRGAAPLQKLLKSAVSNAKNNFHLEESNLYISKITVDEGPKLKRWMPRARGVAGRIQKKTSHITIVLDEMAGVMPQKISSQKTKETAESKEEKAPKSAAILKQKKAVVKPVMEIKNLTAGAGRKKMFRRQVF